MITLWQAVLIALVAVLTELDGNIFGENKMREPIVTGFLVGVILGDVSKGLMLGAQMQLMWMGATANCWIGYRDRWNRWRCSRHLHGNGTRERYHVRCSGLCHHAIR